MGMSLPFLARAMVRDAGGAARTIGILYGINVLGASFGAMATPWVLIRFVGMRGAVTAAAAANLLAAVAALVAAPRPGARARTSGAARPLVRGREPRPAGRWHFGWRSTRRAASAHWPSKSCGSGSSTSRCARPPSRSGLCCLSTSSAAPPVAWPVRARRTGEEAPVVVPLLPVPAARLVRRRHPADRPSAPDTPVLAYFDEAWRTTRSVRLGRDTDLGRLAATYLGLPALIFGVPTVLMGLSFPVLQRAVQDDVRTSGRKVGLLQAANIAGCIVGSLLVGLLLLDWIGTAGSFRLLAGVGVLFSGLGIRFYGSRSAFLPLAVALVGLIFGLPDGDRLWARLHGSTREAILVDEDATGVAALAPVGDMWEVWINGRSFSRLPFGGMHSVLGAIPAIVHPAPGRWRSSVSGPATPHGRSAAAAPRRSGSQCSRSVAPTWVSSSACGSRARPLRRSPLSSPTRASGTSSRTAATAWRTRASASTSSEIDALWPSNAYSGNLYSVEFFELCALRLAPGGLDVLVVPDRARAPLLPASVPARDPDAGRPNHGREQRPSRARPFGLAPAGDGRAGHRLSGSRAGPGGARGPASPRRRRRLSPPAVRS